MNAKSEIPKLRIIETNGLEDEGKPFVGRKLGEIDVHLMRSNRVLEEIIKVSFLIVPQKRIAVIMRVGNGT